MRMARARALRLPAAGYRVHWRDTTEAAWTHSRDAGTAALNSPPEQDGDGRDAIVHGMQDE
jgi:hypothetical protein